MPKAGPDLEARRALVARFMTHNHGPRCQRDPNVLCSYGYPKDLHQETTIAEDGKVTYRRRSEEDRWIVPHHTGLLQEFRSHINVEVCWGPDSFGYLFKYFWKRKQRNLPSYQD